MRILRTKQELKQVPPLSKFFGHKVYATFDQLHEVLGDPLYKSKIPYWACEMEGEIVLIERCNDSKNPEPNELTQWEVSGENSSSTSSAKRYLNQEILNKSINSI